MNHRPKTLDDLPQFTVSAVHNGTDGTAEISGSFTDTAHVREGRCWLYVPQARSMIGDLTLLDRLKKTAVFLAPWPNTALATGMQFAYVNGNWDAATVDMVLDAKRVWKCLTFSPRDSAVYRNSAVSGWLVEQPADRPVPEGMTDVEIRKNGWDHEHCKLCNTHIALEPLGKPVGYVDEADDWVCESCYERFVIPHDLSFMG